MEVKSLENQESSEGGESGYINIPLKKETRSFIIIKHRTCSPEYKPTSSTNGYTKFSVFYSIFRYIVIHILIYANRFINTHYQKPFPRKSSIDKKRIAYI